MLDEIFSEITKRLPKGVLVDGFSPGPKNEIVLHYRGLFSRNERILLRHKIMDRYGIDLMFHKMRNEETEDSQQEEENNA